MVKKQCGGANWLVSLAATYAVIYYLLYVLSAEGNLWIISLIVTVLLTVAAATCPLKNK